MADSQVKSTGIDYFQIHMKLVRIDLSMFLSVNFQCSIAIKFSDCFIANSIT